MYNPKKMQQRLKMLRKQEGITQSDIAEYLKITQSNYNQMEQGKQLPTIRQLVELRILYKCSLDYLIEGN